MSSICLPNRHLTDNSSSCFNVVGAGARVAGTRETQETINTRTRVTRNAQIQIKGAIVKRGKAAPKKLSPKSTPTKNRVTSNHSKILAAKVLIEQTPGAKALSHREKRVVTKTLAGCQDSDGAKIPASEVNSTISKPHVREVLVEALAKVGVTPDKLARVLADGLDAEQTKLFAHEGMIMDARNVTDHPTRHKFLETALTLVGAKPSSVDGPPPSTNFFVFRSHLSGKPIDVPVGAPTDAVVSRRLNAAKVRNRAHA